MSLLSIPEEVVEGHILPHLDNWNDLLRLRRTCQWLKGIVGGYLKTHSERAPEIEINEGDRSFAAYLEMEIPTTKLFINNPSGDVFYEQDVENMTNFLEEYGHLIKHLRVAEMAIELCGTEWDFLEALINLEGLEVGQLGFGTNWMQLTKSELKEREFEKLAVARRDPRYNANKPPIPDNLKQLKFLKIGQDDKKIIGNLVSRHLGWLEAAKKLEYLGLPLTPFWDWGDNEAPYLDTLQIVFGVIGGYMTFASEGQIALKCYDFFAFHNLPAEIMEGMLELGSVSFLALLSGVHKANATLRNVDASWFQAGAGLNFDYAGLGELVVSMVNLKLCVFLENLNFCNLEKIEIKATSMCEVPGNWRQLRHLANWPALKTLDITVDSKGENTKNLLRCLFQGDVRRLNLTELKLKFVGDVDSVAAPKTEDIVASCPNLKKLTLVNWPGTNKSLVKLWEGLRCLEEVSLEACKALGNVAFVGVNTENPVFFKLQNLKKLSLKSLDQMPKITDLLFFLVLRHLNLTHLTLASNKPVESVTPAGVLSLLEGRFPLSIEKFPFQGWSMANVSPKQFAEMEKKFRAFDMV